MYRRYHLTKARIHALRAKAALLNDHFAGGLKDEGLSVMILNDFKRGVDESVWK